MIKLLISSLLFIQVLFFGQLPYMYTSLTSISQLDCFQDQLFYILFHKLTKNQQARNISNHLINIISMHIIIQYPMDHLLPFLHFYLFQHQKHFYTKMELFMIIRVITHIKIIICTKQLDKKSKKIERYKLFLHNQLQVFTVFFECMVIGIAKSTQMAITISAAILIHKWAEALTLGFSYFSAGISRKQALKYTLFHSTLNASAVLFGWIMSESSNTISGIFNGIAGGTFLYICFIQKITKIFNNSERIIPKVVLVLMGLTFACILT